MCRAPEAEESLKKINSLQESHASVCGWAMYADDGDKTSSGHKSNFTDITPNMNAYVIFFFFALI